MQYIIRGFEGRYSLFCYTGTGTDQKTSYVYKDGKIVLFEHEHQAIQIGDKLKLGNPEVDDYKFEVDFMKAIDT